MRKFKVHQMSGNPAIVEGRAFTVYICNIAHQFFVHAAEGGAPAGAVRVVSDVVSGRRVTVVTSSQFMAALRDEVSAAKLAVTEIIAKHGEQRVRSALAGAPAI